MTKLRCDGGSQWAGLEAGMRLVTVLFWQKSWQVVFRPNTCCVFSLCDWVKPHFLQYGTFNKRCFSSQVLQVVSKEINVYGLFSKWKLLFIIKTFFFPSLVHVQYLSLVVSFLLWFDLFLSPLFNLSVFPTWSSDGDSHGVIFGLIC